MKFIQTPLLLLLSTFIISCGDNTTTSPIADVASISLDDKNITIYSTDLEKTLTATATYTDGSKTDATADLAWSSSDSTILGTVVGKILAQKNGGDANLSIDYADTFEDYTSVHIKELISIQYSDVNISDIGTPQIVYLSGTFENNETNVSLPANITYYSDVNSTITDVNATQLTLTVDYNATSVLLRATLFTNTANTVDFNTTFN